VNTALDVAEGSATRGGRRRQTYEIALGEARETRTCLQVAESSKYVRRVEAALYAKRDQVIGTLVNTVR
jgi:four helix bundle protein